MVNLSYLSVFVSGFEWLIKQKVFPNKLIGCSRFPQVGSCSTTFWSQQNKKKLTIEPGCRWATLSESTVCLKPRWLISWNNKTQQEPRTKTDVFPTAWHEQRTKSRNKNHVKGRSLGPPKKRMYFTGDPQIIHDLPLFKFSQLLDMYWRVTVLDTCLNVFVDDLVWLWDLKETK